MKLEKTLSNDSFIPGTINIYSTEAKDSYSDNENDPNSNQITASGLKTHDNIILVPQPTDSPNDPLNWSFGKKIWNLIILLVITGFTAGVSNDAGSTEDSLNELYGISYASMNTGAGVLFIAIGTGTFLMAPFANLYGHKISYIICIFVGLMGSLYFALQKNTADAIINQFFVGWSEACAEAHVQQSISALFFQHQLGSTLTLYMLATSVGTYLGPLIAGFIVESMGFRWVGWLGVFIATGLLITIIFGLHETRFDRHKFSGVINSVRSHDHLDDADEKKFIKKLLGNKNEKIDQVINVQHSSLNSDTGYNELKKSYLQQIKPITKNPNLKGTGFKQYLTQLKLMTKVFLFIPVIYGGLLWGMQDSLLTFYLTVEDDQYYNAPFNYSTNRVAMMNMPCVIGAIIGCMYAGPLSDWFTVWMAKRNNGVMEAEFRLYFLFVPGILAPLGFILFAVSTDKLWNWRVTYFALGLIGYGFACLGDVGLAYLMDAYPEMIIEMMCGVSIINNYMSCVFTFTCSLWLDKMSNTNIFIILGILEFLLMMCALPLIIHGKRIRKYTKAWYVDYINVRDGF